MTLQVDRGIWPCRLGFVELGCDHRAIPRASLDTLAVGHSEDAISIVLMIYERRHRDMPGASGWQSGQCGAPPALMSAFVRAPIVVQPRNMTDTSARAARGQKIDTFLSCLKALQNQQFRPKAEETGFKKFASGNACFQIS